MIASDDAPPADSVNVADHVVQLHVHLGQHFLHVQDGLASAANQLLALAVQEAHAEHFLVRHEGFAQQPRGMQALDPLRVLDVALAPGD